MKKIKVIVKEKTVLELAEDASKGDLIDLKEVVEVDTSYLETIIESGKDKIYESKLEQAKKLMKAETDAEKANLLAEINTLKSNQENSIKLKEAEIEKKYNDKIAELNAKIKVYEATQESNAEKLKLQFDLEKNNALDKQKETYEKIISEKVETINNLQRAKAAMNVKQTGEDLESWCDNEVKSYMQNGLFNCTWTKDNKVVREEDEVKGSKADYIFKIYATKDHNDVELLASVCLDMKDENPESKNTKQNADYYKQLDKNREKKNCKYSVLVSNLEMDKPNTLPIFKVNEYENMYVVRPGYLMVFLNMITSLTTRFASLVLSKEKEIIELKTKMELAEEFDKIKQKYLDKPLENLEKNIDEIVKNSETIKNACKKIDEQCDNIKVKYLNKIKDNIDEFELKLNKSVIKKM